MARSEIEADLVDPVSAGRWELVAAATAGAFCAESVVRGNESPKAWRLHFVLTLAHRLSILYGEFAAEDL